MPHRFLSLPEVKQRVALSRSSIYLRVAQGSFPCPISLGENSVAWHDEDIDRWMAERMAAAGYPEHAPADPLAEQRKAASSANSRADVRVAFSPRAPKRGFTAEQTSTTTLMSARDGRR